MYPGSTTTTAYLSIIVAVYKRCVRRCPPRRMGVVAAGTLSRTACTRGSYVLRRWPSAYCGHDAEGTQWYSNGGLQPHSPSSALLYDALQHRRESHTGSRTSLGFAKGPPVVHADLIYHASDLVPKPSLSRSDSLPTSTNQCRLPLLVRCKSLKLF